jgi:hypothetical protein
MSMHEKIDMALPPKGDTPYDAPSAHQLIEGVNQFISEELDRENTQTNKWKLRIASNALAIAAREIRNIHEDKKMLKGVLDDLEVQSEKELSEALRNGEFDNRLEDIHGILIPLVQKKLLVANPAYLINENDS